MTVAELDADDFAITKNKTIILNKNVLRDRKITEMNIGADSYFASKKAEDSVAHEYGHIIQKKTGNKSLDIMREAYYSLYKSTVSDQELFDLVQKQISLYALESGEFISEVFAKNKTVATGFLKHVLQGY